jgi:aminoglycoside phosphotransferase (APT) family kinase protein
MPIPPQRDAEVTRSRLAGWLSSATGEAVEVGDIGGPAATGFSNETILFDATWAGATHHLVARVKPTQYSIFLESAFDTQYQVMRALADHTAVPIPRLHWYEEDEGWLGAPFWVMDRVDGEVPADNPPYTMEGWLLAARPEQQERLWWSGLDAMAEVHRADFRALGLDAVLDQPARGATGLDQQLAYYADYYAWALDQSPTGARHPVADATWAWLHEHRPPAATEPMGLCWGDARIGNQMFADFRCVAVLDWEMVTLGNPVQDLAWWIFLDRHFTEALGVPRLAGFPTYDATAERWRQLTGLATDQLDYYQVFAGFRFAVVMMRVTQMLVLYELMPPDTDMETDNLVTKLLTSMLGL